MISLLPNDLLSGYDREFPESRTEQLELQARRLHIARKLTSQGEDEPSKGIGSPSKADSIGTSIEVQTGNSMEVLSVQDERLPVVCNRTQHKARIAQILKPKVRPLE